MIDELCQACRSGDGARVEALLERAGTEGARGLLERLGGTRAMVRFLTQRGDVLSPEEEPLGERATARGGLETPREPLGERATARGGLETPREPLGERATARGGLETPREPMVTWLCRQLRYAEPLHLLELREMLTLAQAADREAMVRRLEAHLKFTQPPDPARWSRPITAPAPPSAAAGPRYDRETGCTPVLEALLRGESVVEDELDLNEAAAAGATARVQWLLDEVHHVRPCLRVDEGPGRPLHLAAYFDRPETALMLLDRYGYSAAGDNPPLADGSLIGPRDTWNTSPLAVAIARGNDAVFTVLMNSVDWFQGRRARRK